MKETVIFILCLCVLFGISIIADWLVMQDEKETETQKWHRERMEEQQRRYNLIFDNLPWRK